MEEKSNGLRMRVNWNGNKRRLGNGEKPATQVVGKGMGKKEIKGDGGGKGS